MKKLIPLLMILSISCKKFDLSSNKLEIFSVTQHVSLTIKNNTDHSVNLNNWKLKEVVDFITTRESSYTITSTTLTKGSTVIFSASALGFRLDRADTVVYLYDGAGNLVSRMSGFRFK